MRALAQLFYFLGSLPGLSFLSRIGSNLSRMGALSQQASVTKRNLSNSMGKKKDGEESENEQK